MTYDESEVILILIFVGLIGFGLGEMFNQFAINHDMYTKEQFEQYHKDCIVKEYYYLDSHRHICDKLGITP